MLNDADVLSRLETTLKPADLSAAIRQIRRVSEAWNALRDSDFLNYVLEHPDEINWTPSAIADCSLLFKASGPAVSEIGDPSLESSTNELGQLTSLAREAHTLANQCNDSPEKAVADIHANPHRWVGALSCAWPHLKNPASLLNRLMTKPDPETVHLISVILQANYSATATAELIQPHANQFAPFIFELSKRGEAEFAQLIADEIEAISAQDMAVTTGANQLSLAFAHAASGKYDDANALCTTAWDDSLEASAVVADGLAEIARAEGNSLVELEARRQAFEKGFNPARRANLARAQIENKKAYEASQLIDQPLSIEERIASGMAALQQGFTSEAKTVLDQAKKEALHLGFKDTVWLNWMAEGLRTCGALSEAIESKTYVAGLVPHQSGLEVELAELWEQAGDSSRAAIHAGMALALAPDSTPARKQLAHSLRINDQAESALPHFEKVVIDDETALNEYCECALQTLKPDLAIEIASSMVEAQPESSQAQTMLARALHLNGDIDLARSAIGKAIEFKSDEVDPFLVLSEIQTATGEVDAAGETLLQAIQVDPGDGRAHFARAQWLVLQKRLHEACEHSAQAIILEPQTTPWIVEHADLLSQVGNDAEARTYLEEAIKLQPKNWKVRQALARSLEKTDELERAMHLVAEHPDDISDESRFHVGRIFIKYGLGADPISTQKGLKLVEAAQPPQGNLLEQEFLISQAHEDLGQFPQAIKHYENYLALADTHQDSNTLEGILGYSRSALALEKPETALAFLQANREKYPASLDLLKTLAIAHLSNGEGKQAFNIAQEAVGLNPISNKAKALLSRTAEAIGDIRTAIDAEQDILAQQPQDSAGWSRLAQLYTSINDDAAARSNMAKAIRIDRHDPDRLQDLAAVSGDLGWTDIQLRLLKHAADKLPSDATLQRTLAELSEDMQDFRTAKQAWLRCVAQTPEDSDVIQRAASANAISGDIESAIDLWKQALELDPEDTQVLLSLGQAYIAEGRPQESLIFYQQLLDKDASDPDVLIAVARTFMQYGAPEEGRRLIERTIKQFPDHRETHIARVESLLQSGEGERALQAAEEVIELAVPDAYTIGLAARSAVMANDIERAKVGLDEALHETNLPASATLALLQVSAALSDWRVYTTLLNALTEEESKTTADDHLAMRVLLRARDLEWLHAKALNICKNLPDKDFIEVRLRARHDAVVANAHEPASRSSLDVMLRWMGIIESPSADIESEFAFLSWDEQQEFVQGAAIGFLYANRPAKALELLEQYAPTGPYRAYHTLLTGLAALKLEQLSRAKDAAQLAASFIETRATGSYLLATIYVAESDLEASISALNAALAAWPDESDWHTELAHTYTRSERKEAALPHLQQAVELEPHNTDKLISLARAYRTAGEWSQAETIYARSLQDSPTTAQIWKEAGEVALMLGHASQAEGWFERACSLAPSDAVCLMGSARAALLMGEPKLATERAQSAYKLAPNEPQVLAGFAEILAQQGKIDKAIQAYDRALKISAGDPLVQLARSRLLIKSGQFADAISDLQAVIDLDAEDPVAWSLMAEAHEGTDNLDEALAAINAAVKHAPRTGSYRLTQGRIYRKSGQLDQALKVLREFEASEPENPNLPGEIGQVYEARRETDAALDAYLRAISMNAQDIGSSMRAGLILKGLKSYGHAAEMFERVVKARPKDANALHQLAAVRALQLVHGGIEKQVVAS